MPDENLARGHDDRGKSTRAPARKTVRPATIASSHTQYPGTEGSPRRFVAIGLDFGTAFTKVVIADQSDSFAIRLRPSLNGLDAYLLPGLLRKGAGGLCELANSGEDEGLFENLKLNLIENPDDNLARANAAAFLAIVLQKARHEFMSAHADIFSRSLLDWHLNIGLPAESYDNQTLVDGFLAIARAAWVLSVSTRTIDQGKALLVVRDVLSEKERALARYEGVRDRLIHFEKISVLPEVVAETASYARSPLRNDGLHLLIDVGAGTLDANVFKLFVHEGDDRYSLFMPKVFPLGTVYLARHRIKAFRDKGVDVTDANERLFDQYGGWWSRQQLEMALGIEPEAISHMDGPFQNKVGSALWDVIVEVKARYGQKLHDWREPVRTFLAGGGAADDGYGERVEKLSHDMQQMGQGGLLLRPLPKPDRFRQDGVAEGHFHRFAVAYGLAQDPANLGDFISPRNIPFQVVPAQREDWTDRFVGAERT